MRVTTGSFRGGPIYVETEEATISLVPEVTQSRVLLERMGYDAFMSQDRVEVLETELRGQGCTTGREWSLNG